MSYGQNTRHTHEQPPRLLRQYLAKFHLSNSCFLHPLFGLHSYCAVSNIRAEKSGSSGEGLPRSFLA